MTSTDNVTDSGFAAMNGPSTGKDPWLAFLDEEIINSEKEYTLNPNIVVIIKDLLLANNDMAAANAARRIGTYYTDKDRLDDLDNLYYFVFDLAPFVPYNDSRQDALVKLILELHRLLPQLEICNVCCIFFNYLLSSTLISWLGGWFRPYP
jgi:hypothetical protein